MSRPLRAPVLAVTTVLALVASACGGADDDTATVDGERSEAIEATEAVFAELDGARPGCTVAVRADGEDTVRSFGLADVEAGTELSATSIYDLASVSKQITAGAVALLALDGELSLDDDVTEWLDIGPFPETITIGDLVHHTSGLPDYIPQLDAELSDVTTMDDAVEAITDGRDDDPLFSPGTDFDYSDTNDVLLSLIVEEASGRSLADFTAERIFTPLGMDDSRVRDDQGTPLDRQAQGYEEVAESFAPVGSAWRQTGDGSVFAPPSDLLAWARPFLEGGDGDGVGSSEWVELMQQTGPAPDGDDEYGFGLVVGDGTLSHSGSWIGYSSALVMQPEEALAVAVACNVDRLDAESLAFDVLDVWT